MSQDINNPAEEGMEEVASENAADQSQSNTNPQENQDCNDKIQELQEKYLRLYSDFENFRKRAGRERIDLIQNANKDLLLELLPVYDDFERAVESIDKVEDTQALIEGFKFIFSKFQRLLQQAGLSEIEAIGTTFDPEYHDAITKIPAPDAEMKGKIVDQIQKGYKLNDKIIRHSKVVVGE